MFIQTVKQFRARDISSYCWGRIAQFQNVEWTTKKIIELHRLPNKHHRNARQQADELRHCLRQTYEYCIAAKSVSLATKPVLLYYAAMSAALVEVLFKQTADSRLSKLREHHNCHGLQMSVASDLQVTDSLPSAAAKLVAKAQVGTDGRPKGTFEVWRKSAREFPVAGDIQNEHSTGGANVTYRVLLGSDGAGPSPLPSRGITLLECLQQIPGMQDVLTTAGSRLMMIRGTAQAHLVNGEGQHVLIFHPSWPDLLEKFFELVVVDPKATPFLEIQEITSQSRILRWPSNERFSMNFPAATTLSPDNVYFECGMTRLGEFGHIYLSLQMCGNFARYYPDIWLRHVDMHSELAIAIDQLCQCSEERIGLHLLSELTREMHVPSRN